MNAEFVHFEKSAVGVLHSGQVLRIPGFEHGEEQDHGSVEGHLPHCPADQGGTNAGLEEFEADEESAARCEDAVSTAGDLIGVAAGCDVHYVN